MRKITPILLIILLTMTTVFRLLAQSREITESFRQLEMNSWKDLILMDESHRGDPNIDVLFYHLDIEIAIDSAYIIGDVLCRFTPNIDGLGEIRLDLDRSLMVDNVGLNSLSFLQEGDEIIIQLDDNYNTGDEIEVSVSYRGVPVLAGGYKGLRYEMHNGDEPIIATLSTPFVAHYWYPCKDGPEDKADSVYVDITIEDKVVNGIEMMAVSNGVLENTTTSGGKKTFHWRHRYPIVTYYVMAAISNYIHFDDEYESTSGITLPLDYYAFDEVLQEQQDGVVNLPDAIGFFEEIYGTYPFIDEKYGMTQLGYYGAIENQTNTITNSMEIDWFMVSVHELAHMWFADMITCETWNHAWLNEGFATYSEALYTEHDAGEAAYDSYMDALKYWNGGTIYLGNPLDTFNVFTGIIYYKGAWALHMLRGTVGDELFFKSINDYAHQNDFMYQSATTEDLQEVFETTCNMNLEYYFDQWIYDEYYPIYYYNFVQNSDKLFVMLYQAQEEKYGRRAVFEMPVPIKINFTDDTDTTITVWNDEQLQQFEFELDKQVDLVLIDPDDWILKRVEFRNDLPVGIDETNSSELVKVFPNPASDFINVQIFDENISSAEIKIFNPSGQEVKSQILTEKLSVVSIDDLSIGIYFYRISGKNQKTSITGKFFKD